MLQIGDVVILGPGSEWLWTMAQFLALTVTGFAIFRQLKAQAWANQFTLFANWSDDWSSMKAVRFKLDWHIQLVEQRRELTPARRFVGGWLNDSAAARYNGHVNPRIAWENLGQVAQIYWALILPLVPEFRVNDPRLWVDWERWVDELAERDRKAGKVTDLSPERLARWVPDAIAFFIERLRVEKDTKAGVIPVWPHPTTESAPSPTIAQAAEATPRST